jgi:hypothetical protein
MEENTPMQGVDTAPQDQPEGSVAAKGAANGELTDNAEAEGTTPAEAPEQNAAEAEDDAFVIQFNHEERRITREEAAALAQKGLRLDRLEEQTGTPASELVPMLDKLKFLAAANSKSLPEMIDALAESQDKQLYQSILAECDGNEALANRLFDAEKLKRQTAAESVQKEAAAAQEKEKADLAKRLADEFVELQQELAEFSVVPKSVLDAAVKGKNLTDAYLRYQRAESKKVSAAKATQEQAAKASTGSQADGAGETTNPTIDAMLAGVWAR